MEPTEHDESNGDSIVTNTLSGSNESGGDFAHSADPQEDADSTVNVQEKIFEDYTRTKGNFRNHIICLKMCLIELFNENDLRDFCQSYLHPVYKKIRETDRLDSIVREIVDYCSEHRAYEEFWEAISWVRPGVYQKFYANWKGLYKDSFAADDLEFAIEEDASFVKKDSPARSHPLDEEDRAAIEEWFFTELTCQERSLAIAVALFEGLNRRLLTSVAQQIGQILFDSSAEPETPRPDTLQRINIEIVTGKRNVEHGQTQIQTLAFRKEGQRSKIAELTQSQMLYGRLPDLLKYVYDVGCNANSEMRFFAAQAIGELSTYLPLDDLKEYAILLWAKDSRSSVQKVASRSLVVILNRNLHQSNVFGLLKHWLSLGNSELVETALLTCKYTAQSHWQSTLATLKTLLLRTEITHNTNLIERSIGVISDAYSLYPSGVVNTLHAWIFESKNSTLAWLAGLSFLLVLNPPDTGTEAFDRQKVVEVLYTLWGNTSTSEHVSIQRMTTLKIEEWAREAIQSKQNKHLYSLYQAVFHDLYRQFSGDRLNRLDYYLRRWESNFKREQTHGKKIGMATGDTTSQIGSYLDLIP